MRISHETIYRSLYVQSRGELRSQLTAAAADRARTRRRAAGAPRRAAGSRHGRDRRAPARGRRPRVPGHWEGDLIIGAGNRSAIATLVERQTRYVLLARLARTAPASRSPTRCAERIRSCPRTC